MESFTKKTESLVIEGSGWEEKVSLNMTELQS